MNLPMAPSLPAVPGRAALHADAMSLDQPTAPGRRALEVCSVVVTMNPEVEHFQQLLVALACQVGHVFVIDNGSNAPVRECLEQACARDDVSLIALESNQGIAAAQNVGIRLALKSGAEFVLLSDHDSLPHDDMVAALLGALGARRGAGGKVAAVGPVSIDRRTGTASKFVRLTWRGVRRCGCDDAADGIVPADFLIASGCLIPAEALNAVGLMNEGYFIDHVDTEWCLRARHQGWEILGVCGALLDHTLGDSVIRVWLGRWREVPVHSPVRDYYMFRNTVRMLLTTPMSIAWRITHLYRLSQFAVFFGLGMSPRFRRIRLMTKGIIDGIKGRGGALVEARQGRGTDR
ncbi:glycosyltransferase family 2 protein [Cupriavidus sp. DF5525]|uniref:glycosyltransferase family 2 protein n=1 Tax=Cupriavidus sp. DF5525 TaxID=3160989 RepID=UPI0032DF4271